MSSFFQHTFATGQLGTSLLESSLDQDALSEETLHAMTESLLNEHQLAKFEQDWELCISQRHEVGGRVRITLYRRNGHPEMSVRFCGHTIPSRDALGLPPQVDDLTRRPTPLSDATASRECHGTD